MQRGQALVYILVGVVLIAGVAGGAYYLGRQTTPKPSPAPVIFQTPQPTVDEIANWKTYTNRGYKLSFKYPSDYQIFEQSDGYISILSPLSSKAPEVQATDLKVEIIVELAKQDDTTEKFFQEIRAENPSSPYNNISEITIGGIKAFMVSTDETATFPSDSFYFVVYGKRFSINKFPKNTKRQDQFNQVLSTFKFLP